MIYILAFFFGHWFLSLFCQTFFLHRYSSHKMFAANKFWEKFFYLLTYLSQGSSFLNPRGYAIMHRMHHAYSDTEKDPHSPHFFKDVFGMMWETKRLYNDLIHNRVQTDKEFNGYAPEWKAIDDFADTYFSRISWGVLYTLFYIYMVPAGQWYWFLLLPIHYLMGPIHGAVVNWCGHKYGYSSFDNNDKSKNTTPWGVLMLGELFQNNHHRYPNSPNFAKKWFEFDAAYAVMTTLHFLRIIKLRKVPLQNQSKF